MTTPNQRNAQSKNKRFRSGGPRPLALEPRLMFDGAAVADAAATAAAADPHPVEAESSLVAPAVAVETTSAGTGPTSANREIVFVDGNLQNAMVLASNVRPDADVVMLNGKTDGLAQILAALDGRQDVQGIHILSHGTQGAMQLGSTTLDSAALLAHADMLAAIGQHLSADADILLYGCDIAQGTTGQAFVSELARLTQADVAASVDATGAAAEGGNWQLEKSTGLINVATITYADSIDPFLLGVPVVSSVDDTTYTEGSGAIVVDSSITVTGGSSYDGKYVRFSLTNGQTTDILSLTNAANVNASGAISYSGTSVYLGNGSGRDIIGSIDATENGQGGKALKINFVSSFSNASFESGSLTGWTALNQVVNLGTTSIAGFTSPNDGTYTANAGNDDAYPSTPGSFTTTIDTSQYTDGSRSLRLMSSGMTTASGYDVVHGPVVYSDAFSASAGDKIYFDWRAYAGDDAYDVYGYILNTATGATTAVLDATGASTGASTNWATASATIGTSGSYRFVFVAGTYDYSGGQAAGASLYIDNVRVYGSKVNDAVVTSIARQVAFEATSDAPATASTRIFTVEAMSATGSSATDTGLINITVTNDVPVLGGTAQTLNYTENAATTAIDTVITVTDPDSPANFNGGWLQTQITTNGATEDQLAVINQGTGAGQIGVSGSNVTYGGTVIGTIDSTYNGVDNTALRINLNSNASAAAVQALARDIGYRNTSDAPSTSARTVSYTLNDGGNTGGGALTSSARTATINVTAVDDPSVLTLSTSSKNYNENDSSFFIDSALTVTDVDSTTLSGAKVVISSNFSSSEDSLLAAGSNVTWSGSSGTYINGGETINMSYNATTGVMTLTGTASLANYQAALRAIKYSNSSDNPNVSARGIDITLGNAVMLNFGGKNHYYEYISGSFTWTAAQAAAAGRTFMGLTGYLATITSQTENDFIRQKLQADAWIGASDSASEGTWRWVTGPEAGTLISTGNNSPVTPAGGFSYWNSGEPNDSGSNEDYGEIYSSGASPGKWNDLPNSSQLGYVVEYSDNGGTPAFSKSLTITPVRINDAPQTSGTRTLTAINEDATSNSGALVSSFLTASDPDTTPVTGIAITTLSSSRGTWQFSTDNGAQWTNIGAVSDSSALLLNTMDRVRFIPDGQNADSATLTYRAWDRSNENSTTLKSGQKADTSNNGGTTAYSSGTQVATQNVTAVNDAPTLSASAPSLTPLSEDATNNAGQTIASLLGSSVNDIDSGAQEGVAITSLSSGNGTWEYSTDNGSSWTAVGTVSGNSALLLRDTDKIRFNPDGKNATSASFSYKAWDRSSGSVGSKADTTVSGGTTAFSTTADTASIAVSAVNDAPVLVNTPLNFTGISEDDTSSAGQTVASLLGSKLSDVDSGALQGVAITGSTVINAGKWQIDTGSGWTDLGSVSAGSAMLLRATDKIRYVSDGFQGGTPTLTVRGWDQSTGTFGTTADTTSNGSTTAFSATAVTASIAVSSVNDAPEITTPASDTSFTENAGTPVGAGLGIAIRDDGGQLSKAVVSISNGFTSGDILAVDLTGITGITASYNASTGVLTLSGTKDTASYQTVLRSLTYTTASDDPTANSPTRTLQWKLTDTSNLTGSAGSSTITVIATADAPSIGSIPASWTYTEDDGARIIAPTLSLSDLDDTQLSGATVSISAGYSGAYETLAAVVTGTSISASFNAGTGTLTLSGTDSVANYQKVLRSVTYANAWDYNGLNSGNADYSILDGTNNTRSFTWQVTDANSDGAHGSPAYVAQSSLVGVTNVSIHDANEVPQVNQVNGNVSHITYTEGGAAATLEGQLIVDDDSGVGGSTGITSAFVRITAGLEAGDQLGFFSAPTGWNFTAGSNATSGALENGAGVEISYTWSLASGDMALSTTQGTAVKADYTAVMQGIGYHSTSDDPTASNATRTLIWRVTDSGGLESAVTSLQSTIIDITATNDAPVIAPGGLPADGEVIFIENGSAVALAPNFSLSDPDDTRIASATVVLSGSGFIAANEYLALPGATVSANADWTLANVGGSGLDASYDHASGTLSLTASSPNGASLADVQAVLRQVMYASVDHDPTVSAATRTLSWTVTDVFGSRLTDVPSGNDFDAGMASLSPTSTVTLAPRNDAPTLTVGGTAAYNEGGSAAILDGGLSLADIDDVNLDGAQVWISGGFSAGDTLSASVGSTGITAFYDSATGILTLSGTASKANYQTVLQSVSFTSSAVDPTASNASRSISWQITDANAAGDGALASAVGYSQLDITAFDNPAVLGGLAGVNFTENGSAVPVAPSATLSDADDTTLSGLSVTIASGKTTGDLLSVTADLSATGITITAYNPTTGVLELSGEASLADYQMALRSIVFSSNSEDPTATSATRTLNWTTTSSFGSRATDADGTNDAATGTVTVLNGGNTITVAARNDAPVITLDDGTVSTTDAAVYEQGGTAVYALRVSNSAGGVSLSDADTQDKIASATVSISANGLATDTLSILAPAGWNKVGNVYSKGGSSVTVSFVAGASGQLTLLGEASRADYEELLGSVQFINSSVAPTSNGASRELTWTVTDSNTAGDGARSASGVSLMVIRDRNDAPSFTLSSTSAAYTEGDAAVSVPTVTVSDPDPGEIVTVTLSSSHPTAGTLSVSGGAHYDEVSGVWTMTDTVAHVNAALAAIVFTPGSNNDIDVTLTVQVNDGGEDSVIEPATQTITLNVTAVNDAPEMQPHAPVLGSISEDATSNAGQTVASFRGATSDADSGTQFGIAINSTVDGNGSWEYSLDGTNWLAVGSVSAGSALVLRDTDHIRFVPDGKNGTSASFTYTAWDQGGGTAGSKLDASDTGNATHFSAASDTASLTVTAVNDAPVLTPAAPTLNPLTEDDTGNLGQTVASILGSSVNDVDTGAVRGVAIYSLDAGNGAWEYSVDNRATWNSVGTVSAGQALLLGANDYIRFVPNGMNATTANFAFRAWDQTTGSHGSKANTAVTGGSSAFSAATDTASITVVSAVNDAPDLAIDSPTLNTITEDDVANAGQTVASFLGSTISDVDLDSLQGIAITGETHGNGRWEYSVDGNSVWTSLPSVSDGSALLLRPTDYVRFVPDTKNGTTGTLLYRAWDQTSGSAGTLVNTSINGGTTAFSIARNTLSITVTDVNDVPVNNVNAPPTYSGSGRSDGTLRQDELLTATPGTWHDVDTGAPEATFTYQWQVADNAQGGNVHDISGAEAEQFLLTAAEVGKYVRVKVVANDGTADSAPAYSVFNKVSNIDPQAITDLSGQRSTESVPFTYALPAHAFGDSNEEDTLHYSATLADGSPLPAWLNFDPVTLTFSGTPTGRDIGILSVKVIADDLGGHPASALFSLTVAGVPVIPQVPTALPDGSLGQQGPSDSGSSAPAQSNIPAAGWGIEMTVVPSSNPAASGNSLPGDSMGMGSGAGLLGAGNGLLGREGLTRADGFQIVVHAADNLGDGGLILNSPMPEQYVQKGKIVAFVVPSDTFIHSNPDETINLTARMADGRSLPPWLKFNSTTGRFSGIPPESQSRDLDVLVIARDTQGKEVSTVFKIRVGNAKNNLPVGKPGLTSQLQRAATAR